MTEQRVWKYELPDVVNTIDLPRDAQPLHVAEQHGRICLWAQVDPAAPLRPRTFYVVGTGHPLPPDVLPPLHLGSLLVQAGAFVFHVFESVDARINTAATP